MAKIEGKGTVSFNGIVIGDYITFEINPYSFPYEEMGLVWNECNFNIYEITKTCQCGKEKHGFASHSNWCPKA